MQYVINNNQKPGNAVNLKVRITGYVDGADDQVGAVGVNLITGEEVTVWLTTTGYRAEQDRLSIKQLRDGFEIARNIKIVVPGGVISFKSSFPKTNEDGHYWSQWPNILAFNEKEFKQWVIHVRSAMISAWKNPDGSFFGFLLVYYVDPTRYFHANSSQELHSDIRDFVESSTVPPGFLVRFLDGNGKVAGFTQYKKNWDSKKNRLYSPDEFASLCIKQIDNESSRLSSVVAYNVVPILRYNISPKALSANFPYWSNLSKAFYSMEQPLNDGTTVYNYYCKELFAKLGGKKREFVNNVQFLDPNKETIGSDPVLLGGLEYSAAQNTPMMPEEQSEQPLRQQPSPQSQNSDNSEKQEKPVEQKLSEKSKASVEEQKAKEPIQPKEVESKTPVTLKAPVETESNQELAKPDPFAALESEGAWSGEITDNFSINDGFLQPGQF